MIIPEACSFPSDSISPIFGASILTCLSSWTSQPTEAHSIGFASGKSVRCTHFDNGWELSTHSINTSLTTEIFYHNERQPVRHKKAQSEERALMRMQFAWDAGELYTCTCLRYGNRLTHLNTSVQEPLPHDTCGVRYAF